MVDDKWEGGLSRAVKAHEDDAAVLGHDLKHTTRRKRGNGRGGGRLGMFRQRRWRAWGSCPRPRR